MACNAWRARSIATVRYPIPRGFGVVARRSDRHREPMALPLLIAAEPVADKPCYVGAERRRFADTRHRASDTRIRLGGLGIVAAIATALHILALPVPAGGWVDGFGALLTGLPLAAVFLYRFRFTLLRDVFSVEIGAAVVVCCLGLAGALAGLIPVHSAAVVLGALAVAASLAVTATVRSAVVNTAIRAERRTTAIVVGLGLAAGLSAWADHLVRAAFGARHSTYFAAGLGIAGAMAAIGLARSALRLRRPIVTGAAACLYLVSLVAVLESSASGSRLSLGSCLLFATCSMCVLETSAAELWSAFSHEQRRIIDLSVLSNEQRSALDAERTASATRRHDQKASVLAIEGAISALAGDATGLIPAGTRDHLTTAVKAELARLRRGLDRTQPLDFSPVALRDALTPLIVCTKSEGVNVRLAVPAGMVVDTNTDCLVEIVQNLVDNAADHGQNRSIVVTARGRGQRFEVEVSDRGPGVPDALRDVIFERGVTSRATDHSGLGLFSAKQLAQRLGGTLRVESRRRGGASFILEVAAPKCGRDVG